MLKLDPPPHQMTKAEFVGAYGSVYEHSHWVAEAVWESGLDLTDVSTERLAGKMADIVEAAGHSRQMACLLYTSPSPRDRG